MKKIVLVTGCGGPASTNVIKSLRIVDDNIGIVGTEINKYRLHISQADKSFMAPYATTSDYIDALNEIIDREEVDCILPQPDIEVLKIGEWRGRLHAKTFLPRHETVRCCQDKFLSFKKWEKADIPVPKTKQIETVNDILDFIKDTQGPYWLRATKGAGGTGSTKAWDVSTATSWINYWRCRGEDWKFLIQEYLPGRNIAWHSLWQDGNLITSMARERLEYIYPYLAPSGITGTPTVQKTVYDSRVNEIAERCVKAVDVGYTGLACVDLKEDKTGRPNPTEINAGRMFTTSYFFSYVSHHLCKDYRANFPYLLVKLALDEEIPKLERWNALPENLLWIRHIDMPARLVKDGKVLGVTV